MIVRTTSDLLAKFSPNLSYDDMSDYLTDIVGSEEFCNIEYLRLLQTVSSWTADMEMLPRTLFTSYCIVCQSFYAMG